MFAQEGPQPRLPCLAVQASSHKSHDQFLEEGSTAENTLPIVPHDMELERRESTEVDSSFIDDAQRTRDQHLASRPHERAGGRQRVCPNFEVCYRCFHGETLEDRRGGR